MSPCSFCSRGDLGPGCVGATIGDVLGDGAKKQKRLLQHDANIAAVRVDAVRANVVTVGQNGAFSHIEEPADEIHHRCLAGAAMTYQSDHFAWFNMQIEIKNHLPRAVLEIHAAKFDFAAQAINRYRRRWLCDARTAVENLKNTAGAVRRTSRRGKQLAHRIESSVEPSDKRQENGERADCDLILSNSPSPKAPNHNQAQLRQETDNRPEERPHDIESLVCRHDAIVCLAIAFDLAILLRECLYDADARNRIGQNAGHIVKRPAALLKPFR